MDRVRQRHQFNQEIRRFFEARGFLEVETPVLVPSAGTDPFIAPLQTTVQIGSGSEPFALHTSPEFAMKRLLSEGYERIYQLCKVFRDGEQTDVHAPEFTMLEWYRSGADVDEIIQDVEDLCRSVLPDRVTSGGRDVDLDGVWTRLSMTELIDSVCQIDIRDCQERDALRDAIEHSVGLNPRADGSWDDLFFDLWVRFIDPVLATLGAVFIVDWPRRLAVLSEVHPDDDRLARRFELFIGGLELANGFQELTDATEQERRFVEDNATRRDRGLPEQPTPTEFLEVLRSGLPRSAGVALGVDRLLMLRVGATRISDVLNTP